MATPVNIVHSNSSKYNAKALLSKRKHHFSVYSPRCYMQLVLGDFKFYYLLIQYFGVTIKSIYYFFVCIAMTV